MPDAELYRTGGEATAVIVVDPPPEKLTPAWMQEQRVCSGDDATLVVISPR